MKKAFASLLFIPILLITSFSCKEKSKNINSDASEANKENNSIAKDSNYNPGQEWKLVWSDEFEGDALDANNWNLQVEPAGRFNDEWQRYTNNIDNAYVEDGQLIMKVIHESDDHGMDQYTSARLNTANKQTWKYGRIAARIKLPYGKGMWPAFWMLGANIEENGGDTPWPQCGEIDILEMYGSRDDGVVQANAHYADSSESHNKMGAISYKLDQGKFADEFHIFELEWNENEIIWFVDGNQYASFSISSADKSEFQKEFFLLLNIAVGGSFAGKKDSAGRPDDSTVFPQHMYVDWIRVYKK